MEFPKIAWAIKSRVNNNNNTFVLVNSHRITYGKKSKGSHNLRSFEFPREQRSYVYIS